MKTSRSRTHCVWLNSPGKIFGVFRIFLLALLVSSSGAFAANRCAEMLRHGLGAPVRVVKGGVERTKRFARWTTDTYIPEIVESKGRRLFFRDETETIGTGYFAGFFRPLKPWEELGRGRRTLRALWPVHWVTWAALRGRPRERSFHLIPGIKHLAGEFVARTSHKIWGKRFQFTVPVVMLATALTQNSYGHVLDKLQNMHHNHEVVVDAAMHRTDYLVLLRTDYRYFDIAARYPEPLSADQAKEASQEVRERLGLYDMYYNLRFRDRYLTSNPSDEDLQALLQFPILKPLARFRTLGIPDVPGYRLKPGHTRDPISREALLDLVRATDRLMMRQQLIEEWVNQTPLYQSMKQSPRFADVSVGLENDEFAQEVMTHVRTGEITKLQAKMILQEVSALETEFDKCEVLGVEKIDPASGHVLDFKLMRDAILQKYLSPLIS